METENFRDEVTGEIKMFSKWIISSFLDATFLVLWVLVQWAVGAILEWVKLSFFDSLQAIVFQVLFAVTTLIPIVFYIVQDTAILFYKTRYQIREGKKKYHLE